MLLLFARRQNSPARSITTRGEISWFAYNMPTIELHNELFSQLQELYGQTSISAVDGGIKKSFGEMNEQPRLYIWIKRPSREMFQSPTGRLPTASEMPFITLRITAWGKASWKSTLRNPSATYFVRVIKHLRAKSAPTI